MSKLCETRRSISLLYFKAGKMLNGMVFVISIASQLTYFYDAQSGLVEKCILEVPATLKVGFYWIHCKENLIYVFLQSQFRHSCVCDQSTYFLQQNRQIDRAIYKSLTDT
jgi:hypothetical protein